MIEQSPILITGCPRSNTSMIAAIVNMCGAFGGRMSKRGMFNNDRIREEVIKPYFHVTCADVLGQYPLPDTGKISIPVDWRQKVERIMVDQEYKTGHWMYKDGRSCLTWPVWNFAFPNAKWIIVRRRTGDIVQSCLRTGFMTAFADPGNQKAVGVTSEQDGWSWWVHQHENRFIEMINAGMNVKIVWPERMVEGDYQQMYETLEWLGLPWNKKMVSLIDPLLWDSREKVKNKEIN